MVHKIQWKYMEVFNVKYTQFSVLNTVEFSVKYVHKGQMHETGMLVQSQVGN